MDVKKDRPVSSNTFGHLTPRPPTPPLARSRSARSAQELTAGTDRPPLLRGRTPEPEANQGDIAKMYSSNMFADPPAKRAYFRGPHVFSDGHQRLLYMLREECGRLYSFSQKQKKDLQNAQAATALAKSEAQAYKTRLSDVREQLAEANQKLRDQAEDLATQQETLEELDSLYQATRNKRQSRNMEGVSIDFAQPARRAGAIEMRLGEYAS